MDVDLLQNFLPSDLEAADGCGDELTPAESEASGVTVDGSKCFLLEDAITSPGLSKEWTDEKHNVYINSLEQSFLGQLQHSKRLCGGSRLISVQHVDTLRQNIKKDHVPRNSTFSTEFASTSIQQPVGSTAEVSDQNFVEEYKEKSSYAAVSKRIKRSASDNDQAIYLMCSSVVKEGTMIVQVDEKLTRRFYSGYLGRPC